MKLRYSPTSPYVRKVSICAIELGLADRLERVATNPWDADSDLAIDNPLGRVPALITDSGESLYDSVVICEYLDSHSSAQSLFPADSARWRVLRQHALMNGVLDASVLAVIERMQRPTELQWQGWIDFQLNTVRRALAVAAGEVSKFDRQPLNIAQITAGAMLGYLDFRFPDDINWRAELPALADWYAEFSQRESMQTTVPKMPQQGFS